MLQHAVFFLNGILARAIPRIPRSVKEQLDHDRKQVQEAKLIISEEEIIKQEELGIRQRRWFFQYIGPIFF